MSDKIIQLNEDLIKHDLKDLVRSSVEETLNALLDKEADELVNAENMSAPLTARDTAPVITSEISILPQGKSNGRLLN